MKSGPDHGLEPTEDGVAPCQHSQEPDAEQDIEPEESLEGCCSRKKHHRQDGDDVEDHHVEGHHGAGGRAEAVLEELRHGVDSQAQEDRHEEEGDHYHRDCGEQGPGGDCQTHPAKGLPVHAHQLLGGKAGRDE